MKEVRKKSHFAAVIDLLRLESEAIARTAERLTSAGVDRALEILAECQGKVVVVGVGKSGIIAQKIAATLTSTGTAAIYLHPSDALHGSLGIIAPADAIVAISNSGETEEVVGLLPFLKHRGVPVIAIVGSLNSTIARRAAVAIDAGVDQEACPLNLAPTTSTTVALAIGDALAMTLMQVKGLTTDDFAMNHPAGRLGKRLTLKVSDLMHAGDDNPTTSANASLLQVVSEISRGGVGAVNVVDTDGRLIGIVTDGDVRRALERIELLDLSRTKCGDLMTRGPIVAPVDLLAFDALHMMEDRPSQISVLPVVDHDGICVGLIRLHDIVRSGL